MQVQVSLPLSVLARDNKGHLGRDLPGIDAVQDVHQRRAAAGEQHDEAGKLAAGHDWGRREGVFASGSSCSGGSDPNSELALGWDRSCCSIRGLLPSMVGVGGKITRGSPPGARFWRLLTPSSVRPLLIRLLLRRTAFGCTPVRVHRRGCHVRPIRAVRIRETKNPRVEKLGTSPCLAEFALFKKRNRSDPQYSRLLLGGLGVSCDADHPSC